MSQDNATPSQAPENTPIFQLKSVYVKDLSFEAPNVPEIFFNQTEPKIEVNLRNEMRQLDADHHEVLLIATVTAKAEEKTLYIVEVHQGGAFMLQNIPPEAANVVLNVNSPTILFPYLRESISSAIVRGGFQPLLLAPVNFEAIYQQNLAREQAATEAAPATKH